MDGLGPLVGLIEAQEWDRAWNEFQKYYKLMPTSAKSLLMGSHAAFGRNRPHEANLLVQRAIKAWRPVDTETLRGKTLFHHARVLRKIGDTAIARQLFHQFISEVWTHYPDLAFGLGKAHFYLGLIARSRKEPEEAITSYKRAIALFQERGESVFCAYATQNMAWVLCTLTRVDEAKVALGEVRCMFPEHMPAEVAIEQSLTNAHISLLEGCYAHAKQLLMEVLADGRTCCTAEKRSEAWRLSGQVALAENQLDMAQEMARQALYSAEQACEARLMNDANHLRRLIVLRQNESGGLAM